MISEELLTAREVAARLKLTPLSFYAMRRRRLIPGIKLTRQSWRFRWSEVEAALLAPRVKLLASNIFKVEPYSNKKKPHLKFRVRGEKEGKVVNAFFRSNADAITHARTCNSSIGRSAATLPDTIRGMKPGDPPYRVSPYFASKSPHLKYRVYARIGGRWKGRFFRTEREALTCANTLNFEAEKLRSAQTPADREKFPLGGNAAASMKFPPTGERLTFVDDHNCRIMRKTSFKVYAHRNPARPNCAFMVIGLVAGRRERRFFRTKAEAESYAHRQNVELLNKGREAIDFPSWLRTMAEHCHQLLQPFGATIEDAARFYIAEAARRDKSCCLGVLIEKCLHSKEVQGVSREYQMDLARHYELFALALGPDTIVSQISTAEINGYLESIRSKRDPKNSISAVSINNLRRYLSSLFSYGKANGHCDENPVLAATWRKEIEAEITIFTPEELNRLLLAAPQGWTAFLAIGAFAGIRISELSRLDWRDVDLESRIIRVPARIAKSAKHRPIQIQPCLDAWIRPLAKLEGPIAPVRDFFPAKYLGGALASAGVQDWPRNALRHSFASYHLAHFKNAAALALEMGHANCNMIFRHYRRIVSEKEAEQYWQILPPQNVEAGKVINFGVG